MLRRKSVAAATLSNQIEEVTHLIADGALSVMVNPLHLLCYSDFQRRRIDFEDDDMDDDMKDGGERSLSSTHCVNYVDPYHCSNINGIKGPNSNNNTTAIVDTVVVDDAQQGGNNDNIKGSSNVNSLTRSPTPSVSPCYSSPNAVDSATSVEVFSLIDHHDGTTTTPCTPPVELS